MNLASSECPAVVGVPELMIKSYAAAVGLPRCTLNLRTPAPPPTAATLLLPSRGSTAHNGAREVRSCYSELMSAEPHPEPEQQNGQPHSSKRRRTGDNDVALHDGALAGAPVAVAPMPRGILIDMDGTLCTSVAHESGGNRVTPATAGALRDYAAGGGIVVVATGRPAARAVEVLDRDLDGIVSYVICFDGARVLKRAGSEWAPIWTSGLAAPRAAKIIGALAGTLEGAPCHFGVQLLNDKDDGAGSYGSLVSSARLIELINGAKPQWVEMIRKERRLENHGLPPVLPLQQLLARLEGGAAEVGWIRVVHEGALGGAELSARVAQTLAAEGLLGGAGKAEAEAAAAAEVEEPQPLLAVGRGDSGDGRAGFAALSTATVRRSGTDKSAALAFLATRELPDLPPRDVWAFGDGKNDVGMFAWAGRSFAPSNASSVAKEAAGSVCDKSNDQDFIADVLCESAGVAAAR